ncbi:DUF4167 domain-containing protein [Azospirillum brasilense]|uniref:DUF4167 domain-containing protein n=1 Tax=Azospirillum brasilense TaxID=192 RepID=A0A235H4L8_AZOBR|nr:DUF4167 domain-containing protein [Azospirillum brasilense]OYD80155.1 hypothetical protein CHT98_32710 [Azospirillum brasilense]
MSPSSTRTNRGSQQNFKTARPHGTAGQSVTRPAFRVNGSAQQKHAQWLTRAVEAERSGDAVEAELCRQHAEHWFRVSRGQD